MRKPPQRLHLSRGVGLIDALVALAILAFGMLGMTRLQARMVSQASESQMRSTAMQLSAELLNTALVDPANAACYTLPQAGVCNSAVAKAHATAWASRATATLPGTSSAGAVLAANGRMTVTINWTGKESQEARSLVAITDVRP